MPAQVVNAFSVDVEDYFQVAAFESVIDRGAWSDYECRIPANVSRLLDLFAEHSTHATFFTLGWVAERFPELIRRIAAAGHEVASHGYDHTRLTNMTPAQLRADLSRTKGLLEDVVGKPVLGYRAPSYSIGRHNLWALDVLAETGHIYSSSIYPVRHDLYGMPEAPRFAYPAAAGGIVEIPPTTVELFGQNFPCSGGGYFRLLPYRWSRWALQRVNTRDRQPCIFYMHPWEIDALQPRVARAGLRSRFRHYVNLRLMEPRITRLLRDFQWDRMDRVFADVLPRP
ncbi:MAG TPA: XrtA system polysaccharide deacetylase [Steroidobacteraceae bacterium]|nr:XrtA system polysaccharide deacetylase [Steroidobacteraceae bacterium]